MKTAAIRIHALVKSIGLEKARVVGHDIGLMVAYAYAAQFPAETEKLVVMDAFLPGVPGWEDVYNNPGIWHFRFNGPTPEALVRGRERTYFDYFWNDFAADIRFQKPTARRSRQPMLAPDACEPVGRISFPSSKQPGILHNSPKPRSPCQSWRLAARRPTERYWVSK
jgi:pimeloyl-ACP methyl ester carboxylesterase